MPKYTLVTDGKKLRGEAMPRIVANFRACVVGRTITDAGYLKMDGETWPCLFLDNGESILAYRDDEGNGPGVLSVNASIMLCQTQPK